MEEMIESERMNDVVQDLGQIRWKSGTNRRWGKNPAKKSSSFSHFSLRIPLSPHNGDPQDTPEAQ